MKWEDIPREQIAHYAGRDARLHAALELQGVRRPASQASVEAWLRRELTGANRTVKEELAEAERKLGRALMRVVDAERRVRELRERRDTLTKAARRRS
ncbi:MAG TPA: hypothetical protein VF329_15235 [Gammaproteobacteria bacterium]